MKKILCLFSALTLVLISSCSSDDSPSDSSIVLLKKEISTDSDGDKVTTNYEYNGNKLVSVTVQGQSDGLYFTYSDDLITKIEFKYEGKVEQVNTYEYDSNKRLVSFVRVELIDELGSKEVYTYNTDGTVTIKNYIGDDKSQTQFNGNGKITFSGGEVTEIETDYSPKRTYTYDDKNNPFKNILGYNKISFVEGEASGILHNIVSEKSNDKVISSVIYTYNSDNYPIKGVGTEDGETGTIELFY